MTNTPISPALIKELQQHYDLSFDDSGIKLTGGYECDVWRVGDYVMRISPEWRSDAELNWTYGYVTELGKEIPEVVAPIKTKDDAYFFRFENRPVLVFPYVEGTPLDSDNPEHLRQSAELLARIHVALMRLSDGTTRPPSHPSAPTEEPIQDDPKYIQDDALDDWYNEFVQQEDLPMGLMHGDYYRANILCDGNMIAGVIDWDGLHNGAIICEIAWSTWEHCHTEAGDNLDMHKALPFLMAYLQINDVMSGQLSAAIVPLIRHHLRYEIRRSLAMEEAGEDWDNEYRQQEIRAFQNLRPLVFSIF